MNIVANSRNELQGFYTITVRNSDGDIRTCHRFPNIITDNGLNGIGTNGTSWMTTIALGTGTATPAPSDTSLSGTVVTDTTAYSATTGFSAGPPIYSSIIYPKVFPQGVATGIWTEVGIGRTSTNLWSRALILDGGGLPTTLTILSTDIVTIEYELRVYPSVVDVTGTRNLGGVDYNYTIRPSNLTAYASCSVATFVEGLLMNLPSTGSVTYYTGTIGAVTSNPSGTTTTSGSMAVAAYSSGSYTKTLTISSSITQGNLTGGVGAIRISLGNTSLSPQGSIFYQCGFTPSIPKTNSFTMSLTFSLTWARRP